MKNSSKVKGICKVHKEWIRDLNYSAESGRIQEVHIFDSGYGVLREINPKHYGIIREYKRAQYLFIDIDILLQSMKEFSKERRKVIKKINENSTMILELMDLMIEKLEMVEKIERQIKISRHQGERA